MPNVPGINKHAKPGKTSTLPMKWLSTYEFNPEAYKIYEEELKKNGKPFDPIQAAEQLGGNIAQLCLTVLPNGLRYVTIHSVNDGTRIYNDCAYGGRKICDCTCCQLDFPTAEIPEVIKNADLGDGFKLINTASRFMTYQETVSRIKKEFTVNGKNVEVRYSINPDDCGRNGYLKFFYEISVPGELTVEVQTKGVVTKKNVSTTAKNIKVEIFTKYVDGRQIVTSASLRIEHNFPINPTNDRWDVVEFRFGSGGVLKEVTCISQSNETNLEWNTPDLVQALKKGRNIQMSYSADSSESTVLAEAIFGKNITALKLDGETTLEKIMAVAIATADANLTDLLTFIEA